MINISEGICKHFAGLSSFYIPVSYNKDINIKIKECGEYFFHKKEMLWEVPATSLTQILDSLTFLDDININLLEESKPLGEQREISLTYKIPPFKHQIEAINYGLNHNKWLLLDTMGLGKTKSIIHIAQELKARKLIDHCLIVCGINTLKSNWKNEVTIHSDETAIVIGEKYITKGLHKGEVANTSASVKERAKQIMNPISEFFVICNIENFRNDDFLNAILKSKNKFNMIAFDEAHKAKNPNSQQGKGLLKITGDYMIAATGTLLLNNPLDAYMPLKWIGKEKTCLTNFQNYFCEFSPYIKGAIVGFKHIDVLKEEIESCSLRRTKDILDLPEKTIIKEFVDMNDAQAKFYTDITNGIKNEVDKVKLSTSNLLAMIARLRQATACPSILTTSGIKSSKLERCEDLIEEITSNNEKVVVMSNFKESLNVLYNNLLAKGYKPLLCTGDTASVQIDTNKSLFQNKSEYNILLCTWQKMGTGHTLTAASYMIHIDTAYTFGLFDQTCDRIHRIGAKKPVFIYNLICKNTIDERVAQILDKKKAISDFIVDDKIVDDNALASLQEFIEGL